MQNSTHKTLTAIDYASYMENAISYAQYLNEMEQAIAQPTGEKAQYLPINWQRLSRLNKIKTLKEETLIALQQINQTQNWLVISEHWCGDASQILPVLVQMAEANELINLKIVYRDENEHLIDAHLTDGKARAIPKLLILDSEYNLINEWGPRPIEGQKLVKDIKMQADTNVDYATELHKWYARNKQVAIQNEVIKLIV